LDHPNDYFDVIFISNRFNKMMDLTLDLFNGESGDESGVCQLRHGSDFLAIKGTW
jgi:hypothetical protein